MAHPQPHPAQGRLRILFVFARAAHGPEEVELCRLARALDPARHAITLLSCAQPEGPVLQALVAAGLQVDGTAWDLGPDETVEYLVRCLAGFDLVVGGRAVPALDAALDRMHIHPPLIERRIGGTAAPAPRAARFLAATETDRRSAASQMPGRGHHMLAMPMMLDIRPVDPLTRAAVRAGWGLAADQVVAGWTGPMGGLPDIGMPVIHLGDGLPDRLQLSALDILVCPGTGGDAQRAMAEAGALGLPVIAAEAVREGQTGLCVPEGDPGAIARAIRMLACDANMRTRLGQTLRAEVTARAGAATLAPRWQALFAEVLAERTVAPPTLFQSFVQGGFECSTHRLRNGRRLDVIAATGHDARAEADYRQLARIGLRTFRDGVRWHLAERQPGRHDLSAFRPMAAAASRAGVQVIWDLMHYGWPDDLDIWQPAFPDRFAAFARATARALAEVTDAVPFWCPVNEISFFSWGGGDVGYLNPFANGRGFELKVQLARASIAAMHALREVDPRARFVHCEPLIAIHHDDATGRPRAEAEGWHQAQFQAYDLIAGRIWPQIGGDPSLLDIIGVNYYTNNQWIHGGPPIDLDHQSYRPLSDLLFETYARYGRPLFIAETGVEDDRRAPWFRYVMAEAARARRRGVPLEGVCLYPVLNHPGWDDDRDCHNGLLTQGLQGTLRGVDPALGAAVAEAVTAFPGAREPFPAFRVG